MPTRCGAAGSPISCRSADCTSPPRLALAMLLTLRLLAVSERLALRFNLVLVAAVRGAGRHRLYAADRHAGADVARAASPRFWFLAEWRWAAIAISLQARRSRRARCASVPPGSAGRRQLPDEFRRGDLDHRAPSFGARARNGCRRARNPCRRGCCARIGGLMLTGLVVEIALMPFALYHFHRAGLYGVGANLIAIPLTTFVIMPLEAAALLLDTVGAGAPLWAADRLVDRRMLALAHRVGDAEGAVAMLPTMPRWAFALMVVRRTLAVPVDWASAAIGVRAVPGWRDWRGDGADPRSAGHRGWPASRPRPPGWCAVAAAEPKRRFRS